MEDKNQAKGKKKSLPKETLVKTINGEGHGAVAGNASAKNLNRNGSERLNRFALTHTYSAAKLQQNTETTKRKVKNLINNGYLIKSSASEVDIVRNLSKALSISVDLFSLVARCHDFHCVDDSSRQRHRLIPLWSPFLPRKESQGQSLRSRPGAVRNDLPLYRK